MPDSGLRIRPLSSPDRDAVLRIYADGIATVDGTFETEAPPWERGGRWRDTVIVERRSARAGLPDWPAA